jgi:hypothetical protein
MLPVLAQAQEATLSGTVTDSTGGALPGVTVQAVHEATGNSFEAVTDERGDYRLPLRVGAYRISAELSGFAPAARTVTLLVGQEAVINLQLSVSGLQESVTVTGEAPLLDITESTLSGNIDPRQLETLPVQGRAWVDLVMLAPGARVNEVQSDQPSTVGDRGSRRGGDYQLNVDGQQVSSLFTGTTESTHPRISRDAIAEFEFISSRFDATQGRSSGLQVNAITKSGTNTLSGSVGSYFRHDKLNAADHVTGQVLPYQNQQISMTLGGPIRRDRIHFFGNYEYERAPDTHIYQTPYPYMNAVFDAKRTEKKAGGRVDTQFSPQTRFTVRGNGSWAYEPASGSSFDSAPSGRAGFQFETQQFLGTLTQVINSRSVNEVRVGRVYYVGDQIQADIINPNAVVVPNTATGVAMLGFSAGGAEQTADRQAATLLSFRDDLTLSFAGRGRHSVKLGGEYIHQTMDDTRCVRCEGALDATGGRIPAPVELVFPNVYDPSTWNLNLLNPVVIRWRQAFSSGGLGGSVLKRNITALWLQDDWTPTPRLTLNLGVRYDVELGAFATTYGQRQLQPIPLDEEPDDTNNFGPRLGFTYSWNDRTVFRGGFGKYFGTIQNNHYGAYYANTINIAIANDGRPDFASNPHNGPTPTFESLLARLCTPALAPGCVRHEYPTGGAAFAGPNLEMPYSWQSSIGFQRQVGATMAFEADYVYTGSRKRMTDMPINLTYNPATGANYPFSDISRRPMPHWGYVSVSLNNDQPHNYHGLQTSFTRRFSGRWQASGTYTLAGTWDGDPTQLVGSELTPVPFELAADYGGPSSYSLALGDQRHRAVLNGIWDMGLGFELSGLYFYGSGVRYYVSYNADLRQMGSQRPNSLRLRPNGTIIPRNSFVGDPIHRVDLRLQRRFPLGGRARLDGIIEMFNAFNHANFGNYSLNEAAPASFGRPTLSGRGSATAYVARTLQLGVRFAF